MDKTNLLFLVNKINSLNTIIAFILSGLFILMIFLKKKIFLKQRSVFIFPLIITFLATFISLFYSEYVGYQPCKLCWFQRILMYPQLILFTLAFFLNDKKVFFYSLILSIIGLIISLYHYLLQFNFIKNEACYLVGYSVSCVKRFTTEFGFITIPLMAAAAFLLLITYGLLVIKNNQKNNY